MNRALVSRRQRGVFPVRHGLDRRVVVVRQVALDEIEDGAGCEAAALTESSSYRIIYSGFLKAARNAVSA